MKKSNKAWKKWIYATLSAVLALSLAACSAGNENNNASGTEGAEEEKLNVVTTFYPLYDFAKKIGGDHVEVRNLVSAGADPHHWSPSTSDMAAMAGSDVFIYNGAGFELWIDGFLNSMDTQAIVIEATDGLQLLKAGSNGHAHDDDDNAHDHEPGHEEDHDHDHDHGHEEDHAHDHEPGHEEDHDYDHDHGHEEDHDHDHDYGHEEDHDHDHEHGHEEDHDHDHEHGHEEDHDHDHEHGHEEDHDHDHEHGHEEDHDHDHEHGHEEDHDHDHDHGHEDDHAHDHGEFDPHAWVSPTRAMQMAENIKNGLIEADPDNREDYEAGYENLISQLEELDEAIAEAVASGNRDHVVVSHNAFAYLAEDYGFVQYSVMGLSPEAEPTVQQLAAISNLIEEHNVEYILFEVLATPRVAETLANDLQIETLVFNPVEGLTREQEEAGEDYFSVMKENIETLKLALQ